MNFKLWLNKGGGLRNGHRPEESEAGNIHIVGKYTFNTYIQKYTYCGK